MTATHTDEVSAEAILAEARASTGFSAFGPDDFREGLQRNLSGMAAIPFTPDGRKAAYAELVADMAKRLRIEAWCNTHPESQDQEIDGPLLVCGLPRTGTTATAAMLALDGRFRFPRPWEGNSPTPPPVLGEEDQDPRVIAAREMARHYKDSAIHLFNPDGPEEDLSMLAGLTMRHLRGRYPMPDNYMEWWIADDFRSTYAYHERVLKLLQSRRPPNRWLLKAPPHLFKLEAFAAQYPNAQFVMTHRDPTKVIASVSSLYHTFYERQCVPGAIDKHWSGRRGLEFWAEGMRQGLAARARIGEHRFVDVYNRDLIQDPIGAFEKLYDALGLRIEAQLRSKLDAYHRQNAAGQFGSHRYTPEEYGLDEGRIRQAFRDYVERFGL